MTTAQKKTVTVEQTKSPIGRPGSQRQTLRGLLGNRRHQAH